ncbi:hypothetical protein V1477_006563, partial [Vespula maculifrons]
VTFIISELHVDYLPANVQWTTDESSSSRSQQWQKSNIGRQEEEETGGRRHEYSLEWNQNQRRYDVDRPRILHRLEEGEWKTEEEEEEEKEEEEEEEEEE